MVVVRVTVEGVGDLEARPGATLARILAAAGAPAAVWCGARRLDPDHPAGVHPLLEGALLTAGPGGESAPPPGPALTCVAGPDAGGLLALPTATTTLGRAGPHAIADPLLSRAHLRLDPRGRVRDAGSRNGTLLVRAGRARRLGRRWVALEHGDRLHAGGSVLAWSTDDPHDHPGSRPTDLVADLPAVPRTGQLTGRLPALAASLGAGVTLAVALGRWWLALVALAPLLATAALPRGRRHRPAPPPSGLDGLAGLEHPIAIVGPGGAEVARALALATGRASHACPETWTRWLDESDDRGIPAVTVVPVGGAPPTGARTVLRTDDRTVIRAGRSVPWTPALVSPGRADLAARRIAGARSPGLPRQIAWADLPHGETAGTGRGAARAMTVPLGFSDQGPVTLDLDRDGPHVLVAGTTGAGKSALLETLVGALAAAHGPADATVALLDFKGGAGLAACARLPHVAGLLTDLDGGQWRRALLGLRHELEGRKRALAGAGHSGWHAWEAAGAPPRLVVVVDEFQELAAREPAFLPELTRLAAQGRSLGMHLILATQRPAGAVTPAIRANVATVIALRCASDAESRDLVGDAAAAALPADCPGRAIAVAPGWRRTFQAALPLATPTPAAVRLDGEPPAAAPLTTLAREDGTRATPLWLPPLPSTVDPGPGAIGLADLTASRERRAVSWDRAAGPCVVVGPRGPERARALRAVLAATPGAWMLPEDPREAARTAHLALEARPPALVVDDAAVACERLDAAGLGPGEATLEALSRTVPVALVAGPGWSPRWAARAGLVVLLAGLDATEAILWGAPPELAATPAGPGAAVARLETGWAELRLTDPAPVAPPSPCRPLVVHGPLGPEAIGVAGDRARPAILDADRVTVVGDPSPERDHAAAVLGAAGARVECAVSPLGHAGLLAIVGPTPRRLRAWGIDVEPGLADPRPVAGRILLARDGRASLVQLRPDVSSRSRIARITGTHATAPRTPSPTAAHPSSGMPSITEAPTAA